MSGGKAGLSAGQPLRPTGNSTHKPTTPLTHQKLWHRERRNRLKQSKKQNKQTKKTKTTSSQIPWPNKISGRNFMTLNFVTWLLPSALSPPFLLWHLSICLYSPQIQSPGIRIQQAQEISMESTEGHTVTESSKLTIQSVDSNPYSQLSIWQSVFGTSWINKGLLRICEPRQVQLYHNLVFQSMIWFPS